MNIGDAARTSGISAKMIRHYEASGLLPRAARTVAGYRRYEPRDLQTLMFIRRARNAGFSLAQIKKLLALWRNDKRPARDVHALASEHLAQLNAKIAELQSIAAALAHLVAHCHGDDRPECPIVEALADTEPGRPLNAKVAKIAKGTRPHAKG